MSAENSIPSTQGTDLRSLKEKIELLHSRNRLLEVSYILALGTSAIGAVAAAASEAAFVLAGVSVGAICWFVARALYQRALDAIMVDWKSRAQEHKISEEGKSMLNTTLPPFLAAKVQEV